MTANGFRAENRELRAEIARMDDINTALRAEVERMRKACEEAIEFRDREFIMACNERDALRAEVERLRGERDEQVRWVKDLADDLIKAEAEVERLRAENARLGTWDVSADERLPLIKENERLREELSIWKSVFPDIAPERVLPDRSKLEVEVKRLRDELRRWMTGEEVRIMQTEIERLRALLRMWQDAVKIDVKMQGPQYAGVRYLEGRAAWEATCAALEEKP